jgi:hypothetical protein
MLRWLRRSLALPISLGLAGLGGAAPCEAFTDPAAFALAVGGTATLTFESLSGGAVVSGSTQTPPGTSAGIVLPAPLADVLDPGGPALSLIVVADAGDNPAASGTKSLGLDDPGNFDTFTAGSHLGFQFTAPVHAFGLTLVTPEEPGAALFNGDALLLAPGAATTSLSLADGVLLGSFGGREYRAYFLGVVAAAPFTSATLAFGASTPASGFFYNVDDLVVPLPEPAPPAALLAGAAFTGWLRRRRAGRRGTPCR